jgi:uncharacterized protein
MLTPCIKICKIQENVCTGCKRSLFQIANWKKYTDNEREKIVSWLIELEKIEERLKEYYTEYETQMWLDLPHPQLDNKTARETIMNDGSDKVNAILDRLDSDVHI